MVERFRCEVDKGQTPLRIDKYLAEHLADTSRNRIQVAAEAGNVWANGKPVASNYKVKPLDVLQILLDREPIDYTIYRIWDPEENPAAKEAVTHWQVIERYPYVTLVQCRLETGRTHQIRVHMKHIGHPLFADAKYGGMEILKGLRAQKYKQYIENCFAICPRQALHAKTLGFEHPSTGEKMFFDSPWADDFAALIDKWRKYTANYQ